MEDVHAAWSCSRSESETKPNRINRFFTQMGPATWKTGIVGLHYYSLVSLSLSLPLCLQGTCECMFFTIMRLCNLILVLGRAGGKSKAPAIFCKEEEEEEERTRKKKKKQNQKQQQRATTRVSCGCCCTLHYKISNYQHCHFI